MYRLLSHEKSPGFVRKYPSAKLKKQVLSNQKTQQALQESEEKFSAIFKNSPNAFTLSNLENGKIIEINDSFI